MHSRTPPGLVHTLNLLLVMLARLQPHPRQMALLLLRQRRQQRQMRLQQLGEPAQHRLRRQAAPRHLRRLLLRTRQQRQQQQRARTSAWSLREPLRQVVQPPRRQQLLHRMA